jgi:hypothetical protein
MSERKITCASCQTCQGRGRREAAEGEVVPLTYKGWSTRFWMIRPHIKPSDDTTSCEMLLANNIDAFLAYLSSPEFHRAATLFGKPTLKV